MDRIMKLSVVLYGTIITLMLLDLALLFSGLNQSHFMVTILLVFFSISIINRYIKVLKERDIEETITNKNKFKLIKNEV